MVPTPPLALSLPALSSVEGSKGEPRSSSSRTGHAPLPPLTPTAIRWHHQTAR